MVDQAWIHKLVYSKREDTRTTVALELLVIFADYSDKIPDKTQAWRDLHRLLHDKSMGVRYVATKAVGFAFPHISNKMQAWKDLQWLTKDEESIVRKASIEVIGVIFSYIPDKKQACEDLYLLTRDNYIDIRAFANYALGKVAILKATVAESEEDFRKELENALNFFEKSSEEISFENPAEFCLPFYHSYYTLVFKKEEAENEVQKYLAEAKSAVEGSESKEKLLEAVENLSNALKEAERAKDFNEIKGDLNAHRRYCERAADLLSDTEDKAPGATKLIRKGLPIINENIKKIIAQVQEKSGALCKQTLNTPLEDLGKEVNQIGKTLSKIRDPIGLEKGMLNMQTVLSSICAKMPEEERGEAYKLLKKVGDEPYIEDKLPLINMVLRQLPLIS